MLNDALYIYILGLLLVCVIWIVTELPALIILLIRNVIITVEEHKVC